MKADLKESDFLNLASLLNLLRVSRLTEMMIAVVVIGGILSLTIASIFTFGISLFNFSQNKIRLKRLF